MKSSSGEYYIGLDHVRALAVLLVWCWHFLHVHDSNLTTATIFPLSLLSEGHTGVSIFMCLSGYLFAKLLSGKQINFAAFISNRVFRLLPLLAFVIALVGVKLIMQGETVANYLAIIISGLVAPTLPNGGWSITVEFHFYLLLPFLLLAHQRSRLALLGVVATAIFVRILIHAQTNEIQYLSYFTLIGRIDQFLFGILAYQYRGLVRSRHVLMGLTAVAFTLFYAYFDWTLGGYASTSTHPIWIVMPAIEGLAFAMAIAWYDTSFTHSNGPVSRLIARIGTYSYSIYLLHFFIVFELALRINHYLLDLSNVYVALAVALLTFPIMYPIGSVSHRLIELPFLAYRRKYIVTNPPIEKRAPLTPTSQAGHAA